jgi:hypothetical protein
MHFRLKSFGKNRMVCEHMFFNAIIPFDVLHKLTHFLLELMGLKLKLNCYKFFFKNT